MCGFVGYCSLIKDIPFVADQPLIEKLSQIIAHRGPDGQGHFVSTQHQLLMVHRRLSIVDLSDKAAQPMMDEENDTIIVFNGEIYNHLLLRAELEKSGHQFKSLSDTETVLKAYNEWGIAAVEKFEGMFAFVIFDRARNELYAARDRMGIKPLYFSLENNRFSFASEIKALWAFDWVNKKIDSRAVSHYLTHLATPAPTTLFQGIYKIPAGFYLKISDQRAISAHAWYQPQHAISSATSNFTEKEHIDYLQALLLQAVQSHRATDVGTGVLLSGGVDSSLLTALMQSSGEQTETFHISFHGDNNLDRYWAQAVAKRLNTNHHERVISEYDAFNFFSSMVYHQDEPLADTVCIPLYFIARLARETGIKVVLAGEGADELFYGYPAYVRHNQLARWWAPSQHVVPAFVQKTVFHCARHLLPAQSRKLDLINSWADARQLFSSGAHLFSQFGKEQLLHDYDQINDPIVDLFYPGMPQTNDSYAIMDYHRAQLLAQQGDADFSQTALHLELKHRLPELLLMRTDKMTMATSVEARVPFLDQQIVSYALSLPFHYKYRNGQTKYLLKKVAENFLANDLIYRKKVGFGSPVQRWFKNGLYFRPQLLDLLHKNNHGWDEFLNIPHVLEMIKLHDAGKDDYSYHLWALHNLLAYQG